MLEFIVKYWIEVLLGLIVTGLTVVCKKFWSLYQAEKNRQKTKEQKEFYEGLKDLIREGAQQSHVDDQVLQEQINIMKNGLLCIQRKDFKQHCEELLDPNKEITLAEFEELQEEHRSYNGLGGNHDGDTIFDMVCKKATNNLTENK